VITRVSPSPDGPTILEWQLSGQICTPPPVVAHDCEDGRPAKLTMRYTGEDPSTSSNSQTSDKWVATGDPNDAPLVRIVVSDRNKKVIATGLKYFDGIVALGGFFTADAAAVGGDKLGTQTIIRIYDLSGNLLQYVDFHTSCSQPIAIGDTFGAVEIMGFVAVQNGGKKDPKSSKGKSDPKSAKSSKGKKDDNKGKKDDNKGKKGDKKGKK
jgi:hypothetical protein